MVLEEERERERKAREKREGNVLLSQSKERIVRQRELAEERRQNGRGRWKRERLRRREARRW